MYTTRRTFRQFVPAALCFFALSSAHATEETVQPGPLPAATPSSQHAPALQETLAFYLNYASQHDDVYAQPVRVVPSHHYDPDQVDALQARLDRELEERLESGFR